MRLDLTADPVQQKLAAGGVSAVSGAGSLLATAKAWALELLGVPLPTLLAAAAGAFGARMLMPEAKFWQALAATIFWTLAGGWCAELGRWGLGRWLEADPPTAALSGIALIIAALGQRVAPIVWDNGGKALARWFDGIGKGPGS